MVLRDIRSIDEKELEDWLGLQGQPRFRAKQIYQWLWEKGAQSFDTMSNLSKDLRATLSDHFIINPIQFDHTQFSSDGTIKNRFRLHDGHLIESVLIPVQKDRRYTVCVSSQVGCSLTCSFCATGRMKRERNLEPGEIFDQVFLVNQQSLEHFDHPLTNIVFMGMGEPLLAYRTVMSSIKHITSPNGLHMSPKRITLSTVGIAKMIKKLANDQVKFNLALSLHAADDLKRSEIMPINDQNDLSTLIEALTYFYNQTNNRISFEYIAFQDFNDSIEDAKNLVKICQYFPVRVNIIEYNPIGGVPFLKSSEENLDRFAAYLTKRGVRVTVRRSRGRDIDAACGQLANKS